MIALAVWLLACGVVAYAALVALFVAVLAGGAVLMLVGLPFGLVAVGVEEWTLARRRRTAPRGRSMAQVRWEKALAQMFAEPPCTDQRAPIHLGPDARHS